MAAWYHVEWPRGRVYPARMSKREAPFSVPNRLNVVSKRGPVLVAEVHPRVEPGGTGRLISAWKRRNLASKRAVNLLFEPFRVYLHVTSVPVGWQGDEQVLLLGFGDSSDVEEDPMDLAVGGTRYLMRLAGWAEVENERLLGHAKQWLEKVGGNPAPYLPSCPGAMGIGREFLKMFLRDQVEATVMPGLGLSHDDEDGPVRAPIPDAPQQAG